MINAIKGHISGKTDVGTVIEIMVLIFALSSGAVYIVTQTEANDKAILEIYKQMKDQAYITYTLSQNVAQNTAVISRLDSSISESGEAFRAALSLQQDLTKEQILAIRSDRESDKHETSRSFDRLSSTIDRLNDRIDKVAFKEQ